MNNEIAKESSSVVEERRSQSFSYGTTKKEKKKKREVRHRFEVLLSGGVDWIMQERRSQVSADWIIFCIIEMLPTLSHCRFFCSYTQYSLHTIAQQQYKKRTRNSTRFHDI